jgi:hypothetical protein
MNIAEHYQVALQVGPHFGSISYQIPTKEFSVFFPLPEYKEKSRSLSIQASDSTPSNQYPRI